MMSEAGLSLLLIAAALSILQFALGVIGVRAPEHEAARGIRAVAVAQGLCVGLAFLCLIAVFMQTDLSVKLVATNSHPDKPWLYKLAGTWGNHEGSMLLWVTVLGVAGGAVALFERRLKPVSLTATLAAQAAISIGFYAFLLFASNPFERLAVVPPTGQGLNPLLQDPGLAFHPPTLYFGYVGMSVAFSFAVGALITREVGPAFARAMRPWVLGAWIFLTLGITAGSYWAYYELGWGGWWFWDPVENASLMPWLATTALLHSVTVLATRDGLRAWTVMLAVVAFSMSMVGTFLVRSGILTSVHSFAVDPRRGAFILALLALYIGGALALFGLRIGTVREGSRFDPLSREGALVANNLLLSAILGIVMVGTLYPLAAEAISGEKLSVGPPYFNAAAGPLALILVVVMAAGPVLRWRRDEWVPMVRRLALPILIGAAALLAFVLMAPQLRILPLLGLVLAFGVGAASIAPLWKRNLRRTPLFTYGMVISHLGIAVALAGMASESAFTKETLTALNVGETRGVGPYSVTLKSVHPVAGPNWTAMEGEMEAQRSGRSFTAATQARMFSSPPTETNEAAISTAWDGQLYLVLGKQQPDGRWQVRMWWKPFVTLIWLGGIMVALGGLLAMIGRLRRELFSKGAAA
jgi:cytochrome c-type biogenesis protein CcmF